MTTEKLKELLQTRLDFYGQHLSDATLTAQVKGYAAVLGTVPDDIAEQAFWMALGNCRNPNQFLVDWKAAVRSILRKAMPSSSELWQNTLKAAHDISGLLDTYANGGYAGEDKSDCLDKAHQRFKSLPPVVQEWAGSPQGLCDLVNYQSKSDLNRFVRPGFNRILEDATVYDLRFPASPRLNSGELPAMLNR